MENKTEFILKVFILSAILSAIIKYVCPYFNVPAASEIALIVVFLPSILLAIALWWRYQQQQNSVNR
jgi:membrane protein implicated in regulation of membrane protease activity